MGILGALLAGVKYHVAVGERYGRGEVLSEERLPLTGSQMRRGMVSGLRAVRLRCDCGREYVCRLTSLFAAVEPTRSCGCLKQTADVPGEVPDRFLDKILVGDGCWEWQGSRLGVSDYGRFDHEMAHRVSYEYFVGPIPDGLTLDHLCRNRPCVRPSHLEPVTMQENILRGLAPSADNARKIFCIRGHPLFGANLYVTPDGRRQCRICRGMRSSN